MLVVAASVGQPPNSMICCTIKHLVHQAHPPPSGSTASASFIKVVIPDANDARMHCIPWMQSCMEYIAPGMLQ